MTSRIPIIVLAAGQSRRMRGADKLLKTVSGEPLLRRQAHIARAVTTGPVIVTLPRAPHPRHAALAGLDVTPLPVSDADEGINASLRAAIAALPPGTTHALVLLADLPDIEAADLAAIFAAQHAHPESLIWRAATQAGAPGHPILFSAELFDALSHLTGDTGARAVVAAAEPRVTLIALPGDRARRDLDTPEDWAAWRAEDISRA